MSSTCFIYCLLLWSLLSLESHYPLSFILQTQGCFKNDAQKSTKPPKTASLIALTCLGIGWTTSSPPSTIPSFFIFYHPCFSLRPTTSISASWHLNRKRKKNRNRQKKTHLFTSTRFHRISPPSSSCKLDSFNFVVNVFQCPSLSLWNSHCSCCGAAAVAERLGVIKVDDKNLHYRGHLYSHMKVAEVKIEVNCRGREPGCVWYLVLFYF